MAACLDGHDCKSNSSGNKTTICPFSSNCHTVCNLTVTNSHSRHSSSPRPCPSSSPRPCPSSSPRPCPCSSPGHRPSRCHNPSSSPSHFRSSNFSSSLAPTKNIALISVHVKIMAVDFRQILRTFVQLQKLVDEILPCLDKFQILPNRISFLTSPGLQADRDSIDLLPSDVPDAHFPVQIQGDGNCFPRTPVSYTHLTLPTKVNV